MSENQEQPFSISETGNTPIKTFKDLPSTPDLKASLITYRDEYEIAFDAIWTDARLETAAQGIRDFAGVYSEASTPLQEYMDQPNILQGFLGVRPLVSLGSQNSKTGEVASHFYEHGERDRLFPQIRKEFRDLLEKHTHGRIQAATNDFRRVPYVNRLQFDMMNASAIQNVVDENPDLFPITGGLTPLTWLTQNTDAWAMTPQGVNHAAMVKETRSGVLSGFPRSACDKYSEESTSGVNWGKTLINTIRHPGNIDNVVRNVDNFRIKSPDEVGLPFVHYSETDVKWSKEAGALLKFATEFLSLPPHGLPVSKQ